MILLLDSITILGQDLPGTTKVSANFVINDGVQPSIALLCAVRKRTSTPQQGNYFPWRGQQHPQDCYAGRHNPTSLNSASSPWPMTSGASHHVTLDLENLSLHSEYDGTDEITVVKVEKNLLSVTKIKLSVRIGACMRIDGNVSTIWTFPNCTDPYCVNQANHCKASAVYTHMQC